MSLLGDRVHAKARTPLPVHDVTAATKKLAISGETVTFADGAAGTTQQLKLDYDGLMSSTEDRLGKDGDTSIAWTTGTVLTTEVPWRFKNVAGKDDDTSRLATLANGEYMVDYENGYILGKNAITTSTTTDTIAYNVRTNVTTVAASGDDAIAADDSAFTAGTTNVNVGGFVADETATDSVDEGDLGAARMTLDRRQITASENDDDAAWTASDKVSVIGGVYDADGSDILDDGDVGYVRVSELRAMFVEAINTLPNETTGNPGYSVEGFTATPTGPAQHFHDADVDNTAQEMKDDFGNVFKAHVHNPNPDESWFHLYNLPTGSTTVGTSESLAFRVPAEGEIWIDWTIPFSTAITYAATTTVGGSTDPTTGLVLTALYA